MVVALVILYDHRLHTPMYYLICTLSVIEVSIVSSVFPTFFPIVLLGETYISFRCCLLQMYVFHSLVICENYLLNVMAFDRYIAIVYALRYHSIMTSRLCKILICGCFLFGFMTPLVLLILVSGMPFCGPNEIRHLFCDSSPLLTLSCANNSVNIFLDLAITSFPISITAFLIIMTYSKIFLVILKMRTREERKKALSICASHILTAFFFYGSGAFIYFELQNGYSSEYDLASAIHHSVLTPLFSPLAYSLPNTEIKNSVKKFLFSKRLFNRKPSIGPVQFK
ncbi:hypothetical protein XELAEV_18040239mg [Xenopus laevis]|uniref:G-protein coupled receptors family 1 profile domain-containing protein n=1 Tax=Xenopus laevis TaxID=8355 RepID=A0A974CA48_XENLA|nr:hypothetical protein XELAEV_18040239mg [Xenopus laevis]